MELYRYYFILYLTDTDNKITFISNTDPLLYTTDINNAKLYETEVNADNDILQYYERIYELIKNTNIINFYKGYIRKDNRNNIEIIESYIVI